MNPRILLITQRIKGDFTETYKNLSKITWIDSHSTIIYKPVLNTLLAEKSHLFNSMVSSFHIKKDNLITCIL